MINTKTALVVTMLALFTASCASTASPGTPSGRDQGQGQSAPQPSRTLVLITRAEPASVAGVILVATGIGTGTQRRIFNGSLVFRDGASRPLPYLAESLPQLNTDSWRVFPDGRMETTYRLKPNLTWQDGKPLVAEDFVFAFKVFTTPEYGISGSAPQNLMEDVLAPDDRTVIFRWKTTYPDAGTLEGVGASGATPAFMALPRHILERVYLQDKESLPTHSFWTTEYVGSGPYRLDRWEQGAFVEGAAFDGHVLGRPKIDRIRLIWSADPNVILATLLAGEAHVPIDRPFRVQQGVILEADWGARGAGTVSYRPELPRFTQVQHRPEYANPKAVLDLRVRKALAHTIDRNAVNDSLYEGKGIVAPTLIQPGAPYYAELERQVAKYPYDERRAEALMIEAGLRRGADGFWVSPTEGRLNFEIRVIASAQSDSERAIMADTWRKAGLDFEQSSVPPSQNSNGQVLGTFRALSSTGGTGGEEALGNYISSATSGPENRWVGNNRGGWANAEYDRLVALFHSTLDRAERDRQVIQAWKILSEELGLIPLYFNPAVVAYPLSLLGVDISTPDSELAWNIHTWELR